MSRWLIQVDLLLGISMKEDILDIKLIWKLSVTNSNKKQSLDSIATGQNVSR